MRRPAVVGLALLVAAGVAALPADAATRKKPIKGSYALTLVPDPTGEAASVVGEGCVGVNPAGQDRHTFKVPAKGRLAVVLDSPDPTGAGVTDWDLYVLDGDDAIVASSHGGTSHEETSMKLKKKQNLTFWVCNLAGQPNGTVRYLFTYA
jgi:hypothetical protein